VRQLILKDIGPEDIDPELSNLLMDGLHLDERLDKNLLTDEEKRNMTLGDEAVLEGIWAGRAAAQRIKLEEIEEQRKRDRS
jgi:hypothetical protein